MSRSVEVSLLIRSCSKNSLKLHKKVFKTQSRNSLILPCFIGKTIKVYNGKKYISFKVTEDMVGFKLGEFVLTRLRHIYKKK